jgi:hypothetical protein
VLVVPFKSQCEKINEIVRKRKSNKNKKNKQKEKKQREEKINKYKIK